MKTSQGKIPLKEIKASLQENWRGTGNFDVDYGIPSIVEDIMAAGRIHTPLHVDKKTKELYRGFRRYYGAKRIVDDPASPKDVVENLKELDVVFVEDMTPQERLIYRYDDGGFKVLNKSEIVAAYFKLRQNMLEPAQIIPAMLLSLARYTGKTEKLGKADELKGEARTKYLRTWFKGTVDQYFEYAYFCGPIVQEQLILTERAKERDLTDEEKKRKLFDMNRDRCKELYDAAKKGSKELDAVITKFTDTDSGKIPTTPEAKRLSPSEIGTQVSAASSKLRKAILNSVLDNEDSFKHRDAQGKIDSELAAIEALQETAIATLDSVKKEPKLHAVMLAVAYPTPENVEKARKALGVSTETPAPETKKGK